MQFPESTQHQLMQLLAARHQASLRSDAPARHRRPITAALLARALRLPGRSREGQRRRARELVQQARLNGAPIASTGSGYWLATEVDDFAMTERFLRRAGLAQLTTAAQIKRSPAASAARGQLHLGAHLARLRDGVAGQVAHHLFRVRESYERTQPHPQPAALNAPTGLLF